MRRSRGYFVGLRSNGHAAQDTEAIAFTDVYGEYGRIQIQTRAQQEGVAIVQKSATLNRAFDSRQNDELARKPKVVQYSHAIPSLLFDRHYLL